MKITLAFDVYGTVGDPSGMAKHLVDDPGPEMGRCFLKIRSTTGGFSTWHPNWKGIQMTTYNYAEIGGHKMFYREAGDDSAPPIVLLYVLPTSSQKMASGQHQENPCQNQLRS